jgi:hypothetical protein
MSAGRLYMVSTGEAVAGGKNIWLRSLSVFTATAARGAIDLKACDTTAARRPLAGRLARKGHFLGGPIGGGEIAECGVRVADNLEGVAVELVARMELDQSIAKTGCLQLAREL